MSRRWTLAGLLLAAHCAITGAAAADDESVPTQEARSTEPVRTPALRHEHERLDLETTVVTGNRELPKVLYIVPWKKSQIGELPGQPFNTLLDEVLEPLDRDVFRREVRYFEALSRPVDGAESQAPRGQ